MLPEIISLFMILLLIIKIIYKNKYEHMYDMIDYIEPYVPQFKRLDKDIVIDMEHNPLTGVTMHCDGIVEQSIDQLFKYKKGLIDIDYTLEKWMAFLNGSSYLSESVSVKEFLYNVRYLVHAHYNDTDGVIIRLGHRSFVKYDGCMNEKFMISIDKQRYKIIPYPCIMNDVAYNHIKNNNDIDIKTITIFVYNDFDNEKIYNRRGFYKWCGLIKEHEVPVENSIMSRLWNNFLYM